MAVNVWFYSFSTSGGQLKWQCALLLRQYPFCRRCTPEGNIYISRDFWEQWTKKVTQDRSMLHLHSFEGGDLKLVWALVSVVVKSGTSGLFAVGSTDEHYLNWLAQYIDSSVYSDRNVFCSYISCFWFHCWCSLQTGAQICETWELFAWPFWNSQKRKNCCLCSLDWVNFPCNCCFFHLK